VSSIVKTHVPFAGSHASSVQGLPSSHTTDGVARHAPATHASVVHALPSEQVFVSSLAKTHTPFAGLHASSVQELPSSQATEGVPTQAPATQWSVVQALPSEQGFESSFAKRHWPFAGLQESSVQALPSSQTTDGVPTHAPEAQWSVVQALPSEQGFESSFANTHWPFVELQESSVQALPSSHTTEGVPTQAPATQESVVQAFPSEQAFASSFV